MVGYGRERTGRKDRGYKDVRCTCSFIVYYPCSSIQAIGSLGSDIQLPTESFIG
ncbi:hypothetical protein HMPREF1989_01948 [Porphyromonas gingivalis F0566]|nr:hypothetical protein HMPREF1989_01948 [Porphyromonas gingivalis F0566]